MKYLFLLLLPAFYAAALSSGYGATEPVPLLFDRVGNCLNGGCSLQDSPGEMSVVDRCGGREVLPIERVRDVQGADHSGGVSRQRARSARQERIAGKVEGEVGRDSQGRVGVENNLRFQTRREWRRAKPNRWRR